MPLNFRNWVETEKAPDYSFDRFVKSAEELKHTKDSLVGAAKEKEAELDKEIDKKKKDTEDKAKEAEKEPDAKPKPEPKPDAKPEPVDKSSEMDDRQKELINKLRKIAKDRSQDDKGKK